MELRPGDVVRHKATRKRCVVKEIDSDGSVIVTTQDDEMRRYVAEELEPFKEEEPRYIRETEEDR